MSDWTPEDVDALFQGDSNGYEFEYNETAWGQMEHLLERRDRRRQMLWWLVGVLMSTLLLIIAYLYWEGNNTLVNVIDGQIELSPVNEVSPTSEVLETTVSNSIAQNEVQSFIVADIHKIKTPINPINQSAKNKIIDQNNILIKKLKQSEQIESSSVLKEVHHSVSLKTHKGTEQKTAFPSNDLKVVKLATSTELFKATSNNQKQNFTNTHTRLTTRLAPLPSLSKESPLFSIPVDFTKSSLEDLIKVHNTSQEQIPFNTNHFVIGLLMSKELSFVNMADMTSVKWKAGLSVEYRFKGKHALKFGANYSRKDYMTRAMDDYQVADGFWPKSTTPNTASGIGDILELSLTKSFFVNGHDKKGLFVNAGLTSYFLLKERYNYTYDTNDPELLWSWNGTNTNQHWFGIGEISLGYNLPFADKSSLQIAPYAQIPLTGVGHGSLKIFSSGVSVRYNFHLR